MTIFTPHRIVVNQLMELRVAFGHLNGVIVSLYTGTPRNGKRLWRCTTKMTTLTSGSTANCQRYSPAVISTFLNIDWKAIICIVFERRSIKAYSLRWQEATSRNKFQETVNSRTRKLQRCICTQVLCLFCGNAWKTKIKPFEIEQTGLTFQNKKKKRQNDSTWFGNTYQTSTSLQVKINKAFRVMLTRATLFASVCLCDQGIAQMQLC